MKIILLFAFVACAAQPNDDFQKWKKERKIIFKDLKEEIESEGNFRVNAEYVRTSNSKKGQTYQLELNEFANLNFDHFKEKYLGLVLPPEEELGHEVDFAKTATGKTLFEEIDEFSEFIGMVGMGIPPDSLDYRNIMLPIQNQYSCGSCWSHSSMAVLESRIKMVDPNFNTLLSTQYLLDCDTKNQGCIGGWPTSALRWVLNWGENAVPSLANYPYVGRKETCKVYPKIPVFIGAVIQNSTAGNEYVMKQIVANVGPVAVAMHALPSLQLYKSGIYQDPLCNSNCGTVNHAMVIVGYGTDPVTGLDYWIVRNSWGTSYGDQGYVYMIRNAGNNCNIACWAMYTL